VARPGAPAAGRRRCALPVNQDERPGEKHGQDELIAAFAALGGRLTRDEVMRLLGSDEHAGALARLATLLLGGDTAVADQIVRDSLAALQHGWGRLADPGAARIYLYRAVVNRSRSVSGHRPSAGQAAPDAPGAGPAAIGYLDREPWASVLRALPVRQREAVLLRGYAGLSEAQTAQAMGISTGAVRSHLARGVSMLPPPPARTDRGGSAVRSPGTAPEAAGCP
jgi:DNA-directed RNA polymerase specialized sigma24 family protein